MKKLSAPFRWWGGKGDSKRLQNTMINIPYSDGYCEPFFGAGSVFWNRRRSPIEVINDLDGNIINLMRVLQDQKQAEELFRRLLFTMQSRQEFDDACKIMFDTKKSKPIDLAWGFYVKMNQGFSGIPKSKSWRFPKKRLGVELAWWNKLDKFWKWVGRIQKVWVEHQDAIQVMKRWDTENMVFYLDPPYVTNTRKSGCVYNQEQDDGYHKNLVKCILGLSGAVVLSGYNNEIYSQLTKGGWVVREYVVSLNCSHTKHKASKTKVTESIWQNPRCLEILNKKGLGLK